MCRTYEARETRVNPDGEVVLKELLARGWDIVVFCIFDRSDGGVVEGILVEAPVDQTLPQHNA